MPPPSQKVVILAQQIMDLTIQEARDLRDLITASGDDPPDIGVREPGPKRPKTPNTGKRSI